MFTVTCAETLGDMVQIDEYADNTLWVSAREGKNTSGISLDRPRVEALYAELGAWLGRDSATPPETRWSGHIVEEK